MFANDAMQANLGFVLSQTTHVEAGVYRIKYADIQYPQLIPVDTSANPWSTSVSYFSLDGAGKAAWASGKSGDFPMVGMAHAKFETPVYMSGIGYDYGLEEVNQAKMLGINLGNEKAMVARRVSEEFIDNVALTGDTEKGFSGLFNYPGVPQASAQAGAGGSPLWQSKTPDEVIKDFNGNILGVFTGTNTVSMADTALLPWTLYLYMASTPRASGSDLSILAWLKQNNVYTAKTGQPLEIRGVRGLDTAGSGGTGRMIAYRRSPEVLKLHVPMPFQFLPVQMVGLTYTVPGIFRLGGLDVRLPKEIRYLDGIL